MFHIKDDKRAKKSAELVVKAMDEYLSIHDFQDLTITELCNRSTIGRATFYRLFDDLQDVIAYKCELFAEEFSGDVSASNIRELQLRFFKKWMENIDFLKLIVSLGRTDIIFECHRRHLDQIGAVLEKNELATGLTDYHSIVLTNVLVGALLVWCEHDFKESAEQLVKCIGKAVKDVSMMFSWN